VQSRVGEPIRLKRVDSVTLLGYITGTLKNCESGRAQAIFGALREHGKRPGGAGVGTLAASGRDAWGDAAMATRKAFYFTQKARETFLAELSLTANVQSAARAANVHANTFYHHRLNDAAFAHQWRMALLAGYDRLELALIRRALGFKDEPQDGEETGELDVELALRLLTRYKPTVDKATTDAVAANFRASRDAAASLLLTRLQAESRRLGLPTPLATGAGLLVDGAAVVA
jgi:hypothetical protein